MTEETRFEQTAQLARDWAKRQVGEVGDDETQTQSEVDRIEMESMENNIEASDGESGPDEPNAVVASHDQARAAAKAKEAAEAEAEAAEAAAEAAEAAPETVMDLEHDEQASSRDAAMEAMVKANDDASQRIQLAVRLLMEGVREYGCVMANSLRDLIKHAPSLKKLGMLREKNNKNCTIMIFTEGGYRRAEQLQDLFMDVCFSVVEETLALAKLVVEYRKYDDHVGKLSSHIFNRMGAKATVEEAMLNGACKPFTDWNHDDNILCGENGLYETRDGAVSFRKATLADHTYLTTGYDLPEDLDGVRATAGYREFETEFLNIFKNDHTRDWLLRSLARVAFEGKIAYDTKLTIAGVAHRNAAKTTFFKLFMQTLSDLRDGYATRISFATLTTTVDETNASVASMYVNAHRKRFMFADEGGDARRRGLAMSRVKRIADGSGTTVRTAHAAESQTVDHFGLLVIMANPSNFVDCPEKNDRKNFVLLTHRDFATFTHDASEVDVDNHVFLADERFKGDEHLIEHRNYMLALLHSRYDQSHKILATIPDKLAETTRNWDYDLAIDDSKLSDVTVEVLQVQPRQDPFKTADEYTNYLLKQALGHRVRSRGECIPLSVRLLQLEFFE